MISNILNSYLLLIYFSLTTLCGGRQDLSIGFASSSSQDSSYYDDDNSNNTVFIQEGSSSSDGTQVTTIDWTVLAADLLSHNDSAMCTQSYIIGSGNIKQTILVNRTCRCVVFDQVFNSYPPLTQFARIVRPLLYGKIYYHPSNTQYDNLIKQMNQTFESLDELIILLRQIESTIRPMYQTVSKLCSLLSNSPTICQQLNSYGTPLALFVILTEFTACSDRNRFIAKDSESDMVLDGQTNSETDTFLAAIEFLDDISNNDSLPKHMKYKIRMILDFVDSTFQTQDK